MERLATAGWPRPGVGDKLAIVPKPSVRSSHRGGIIIMLYRFLKPEQSLPG